MVLLPILAVAVAAQIPGLRDTRTALELMERSAAHVRPFRNELKFLPSEDAAALIFLIPSIRHPQVLAAVSTWMAQLHATSALPALIKTFDRDYGPTLVRLGPPALFGIQEFGYEAVPTLIQAVRKGSCAERYQCARLLARQLIYRPVDGKLVGIMNSLVRDPDVGMRRVAVEGLWNAALDPHIWSMGNAYYYVVSDPDALRGVLDLAYDQDGSVAAAAVGLLKHLLWTADRSIGLNGEGITYGEFFLWTAERSIASNDNGIDNEELRQLRPKIMALLSSQEPDIRAAAVILENQDEGLDQERLNALADPDPIVFHAALVSSKVSIAERWVPRLVALASSPWPQLRRGAAILLRASLSPQAHEELARLAKDSDPSVRTAAVNGR
jgi:hypothetical protein